MIGKVKSKTWEVLETEQLAREDESYLIFRVIQLLEPELPGQTFGEVILGLKTKGISIGNITRAKRKYFEKYPEKKPEKAKKISMEQEQKYIQEYAK